MRFRDAKDDGVCEGPAVAASRQVYDPRAREEMQGQLFGKGTLKLLGTSSCRTLSSAYF